MGQFESALLCNFTGNDNDVCVCFVLFVKGYNIWYHNSSVQSHNTAKTRLRRNHIKTDIKSNLWHTHPQNN